MKKLLLSLACMAAFTPGFAQEAATEDVAKLEVITENENGTVTITDNFSTISDATYARRFRNATTATAPTEWTIEDGAVVEGKTFKSDLVVATTGETATPGYLRTLAYKGAYISFTLPDYNCSQITLQSYSSIVGGEYAVYAGEEQIETITIVKGVNNNGPIVVEIPEAYRAAGTEYKFENVLGGKDEGATGNFRLQIESVSFVCTPKVEETPWPVAEIADFNYNAAGNNFIVAGQTIRFTCEEGATVSGTISYKKTVDGTVTDVVENFDNNEFVFSGEGVSQNANIIVRATVKGEGHTDSEQTRWDFKFNQVKKLFLLNDNAGFTEVIGGSLCATFSYDITVLNFYSLTIPVEIIATLTNVENEEEVYTATATIDPSQEAAPEAEEGDTEVAPIYPDQLSGTVEVAVKNAGTYKATLTANCVSFKNAALRLANGETETELQIINNIPTGITGVEAEADEAEAVYYNLSGLRVQPSEGMGLLIRVAAGKATKVVF